MTSQENRRKANQRRNRRCRQRLVVAALAGIEPRPSVTVVPASALLAALPPLEHVEPGRRRTRIEE